MARQLQEAYVVAATRTPVGKAPRVSCGTPGPFAARARAPERAAPGAQIDASRIEDVIVGCAMPSTSRDEHRADRPTSSRDCRTPSRDDGQPLLRVGLDAVVDRRRPDPHGRGRHHDRRWNREHEHDPDDGRLAMNAEIFARDENLGIAYGIGLTAEKVAERWQVSARCAVRSPSPRTRRRWPRRRRASSRARSRPPGARQPARSRARRDCRQESPLRPRRRTARRDLGGRAWPSSSPSSRRAAR